VQGIPEEKLVLMTRPDGLPAEVPAKLVGENMEKGYIRGYKEPEEVTKRRAANKIDLVAEVERLKAELAKVESAKPKKIKE